LSYEPDDFRFHWRAAARLFVLLSVCVAASAMFLLWQAGSAAPLRGALPG